MLIFNFWLNTRLLNQKYIFYCKIKFFKKIIKWNCFMTKCIVKWSSKFNKSRIKYRNSICIGNETWLISFALFYHLFLWLVFILFLFIHLFISFYFYIELFCSLVSFPRSAAIDHTPSLIPQMQRSNHLFFTNILAIFI